MGRVISMGPCKFCGGGHNTPCFATFENGFHCFSCGKRESTDRKFYAFRNNIKTQSADLKLPLNCVTNTKEFSPAILAWLYKYYVFEDLIYKYSLAYVPHAKFGVFEGESLIIPHICNNQLMGYQRRFFPNKNFITKGDKTAPLTICNFKSNMIVLVEDYISAIRLAEFTNVLCLQGTSLSYPSLLYIVKEYSNIQIWLDPDEEGQRAALKIKNQIDKNAKSYDRYHAFAIRENRTVNLMFHDKQPKECSNTELQNKLGENNAINVS